MTSFGWIFGTSSSLSLLIFVTTTTTLEWSRMTDDYGGRIFLDIPSISRDNSSNSLFSQVQRLLSIVPLHLQSLTTDNANSSCRRRDTSSGIITRGLVLVVEASGRCCFTRKRTEARGSESREGTQWFWSSGRQPSFMCCKRRIRPKERIPCGRWIGSGHFSLQCGKGMSR